MNLPAITESDCPEVRSFPRRRPRVVLSAYSCCPDWGSEPGVGWGRATHLAQYCDVWVLTEPDGMQPRIDAYLQRHGPIPNLEFVFIPHTPWELKLERQRLLRYVAYRRWLRRAVQVARRLHAQVHFDIAHHLTYNGFREPSYLYQLGIPFVWGPVGGAQHYPWRFLAGAGFSGAAFEATRSLLSMMQLRGSPRIRTAAKHAAAIFAANAENQRKLARAFGVRASLLCDVGTNLEIDETSSPPRTAADTLRILWAGRLNTWKALELLIEALALLPRDVLYELHVIGDGPRRGRWHHLAEKRGVARHIRWYGDVPHEDALEQFRSADVFAFTSLRDTTGTVVLEAIGAGKPVICLDHQGAGEVVTPQCGIKIPVTTRHDIHRRFAEAIALLQRNRSLCHALGEGAKRRAAEYRWSLQARRIAQTYNRVLESVGSDARCDLDRQADAPNGIWAEDQFEDRAARMGSATT